MKTQPGNNPRVLSDSSREQKDILYYYCEIGCGVSIGEPLISEEEGDKAVWAADI